MPTTSHAAPLSSAGSDLVFVMGGIRSGTTLLRKILDSHSALHAPPETWFLLPLINLWYGSGDAEGYNPKQAATALQSIASPEQFRAAARAFAGTIYANRPPGTRFVVDKTPYYLRIADEIAALFPAARFLILTRDPRATLWSRASWAHSATDDPERLRPGVVRDVHALAHIATTYAARSTLVSYEALCRTPERAVRAVTEFIGVPYEPAMIEYGAHAHQDGYGDELSRHHHAPHADSVDRWRGALPDAEAEAVLDDCGADALATLDLTPDTAGAPNGAAAHAEVKPASRTGTARRVLVILHDGTNSRDVLLDLAHGFRDAGAELTTFSLESYIRRAAAGESEDALRTAFTNELTDAITESGVELVVSMWAIAIGSLHHTEFNGEFVSFFRRCGVPHLQFWLDSPERAHDGAFTSEFGKATVRCPSCIHLINNPGTADEMASLWGFSNVAPMPYGVNPARFYPPADDAPPPDFDIVFACGPGAPPPTEVMLEELDADVPNDERIRRDLLPTVRDGVIERLAPSFEAPERDGLATVVATLGELQLANRHLSVLDRLRAIAAHEPALAPIIERVQRDHALYITLAAGVRELETWRRLFALSWLSRRFRCAAFGRTSTTRWPLEIEDFGFIPYDEQCPLYHRGKLGLNVMRWQDDIGVNIKPIEIAASGVAPVSEARSGLDQLLEPGREVAVFASMSQLGPTVRSLLDDDDARRELAQRAHARVLRDHTWRTRAQALLELIPAPAARRTATARPRAQETGTP